MDSSSGPPKSDPNLPAWGRIDAYEVQFSSSAPNEEAEPLLIPDFPDELITEILSRLPARSLGRFKCVSKSWLSLLSSRQFIKAHLAMASGRDDYSHHGLIFTVRSPHFRYHFKRCSASPVLFPASRGATSASTAKVTDIDYPMKNPDKSFWFEGACNGLVCISVDKKHLFLWNPCIKKVKKLPDIDMKVKFCRHMMFGFGYDMLHDDYKVVRIYFTFCGGAVKKTEVKLYSLKSSSWSRIGKFKGCIPLMDSSHDASGNLRRSADPGRFIYVEESAHCASGNLHWVASPDRVVWKIVSLDLAKKTFGEIELPVFEGVVEHRAIRELGGCLSVLYDYAKRGVHVWVMKVYGHKDSWTKVVSVPYLDYPGYFGFSFPVWLLMNGEILLILHSVLVLYSPKSNNFKLYPWRSGLENVNMFVESLISPDLHDGEQSQLQ